MLIGYFEPYKGYRGTIEYDEENDIIYGKLLDTKDLVNYELSDFFNTDIILLYEEFTEAVDDYIDFKKEMNNEIF